jgi:hypothetical protein
MDLQDFRILSGQHPNTNIVITETIATETTARNALSAMKKILVKLDEISGNVSRQDAIYVLDTAACIETSSILLKANKISEAANKYRNAIYLPKLEGFISQEIAIVAAYFETYYKTFYSDQKVELTSPVTESSSFISKKIKLQVEGVLENIEGAYLTAADWSYNDIAHDYVMLRQMMDFLVKGETDKAVDRYTISGIQQKNRFDSYMKDFSELSTLLKGKKIITEGVSVEDIVQILKGLKDILNLDTDVIPYKDEDLGYDPADVDPETEMSFEDAMGEHDSAYSSEDMMHATEDEEGCGECGPDCDCDPCQAKYGTEENEETEIEPSHDEDCDCQECQPKHGLHCDCDECEEKYGHGKEEECTCNCVCPKCHPADVEVQTEPEEEEEVETPKKKYSFLSETKTPDPSIAVIADITATDADKSKDEIIASGSDVRKIEVPKTVISKIEKAIDDNYNQAKIYNNEFLFKMAGVLEKLAAALKGDFTYDDAFQVQMYLMELPTTYRYELPTEVQLFFMNVGRADYYTQSVQADEK